MRQVLMNKNILGTKGLFLTLALMLAGVGSAQAAFTNPGAIVSTFDVFPDISASNVDISYNATTGAFSAIGNATTIALSSLNQGAITPGTAGSYLLTAIIDNAGNATSGSLTINGSALGFTSPLLTSLSLAGFESELGGGVTNGNLVFLFESLGGDTANNASDPFFGRTAGVILSGLTGYSGNFNNSWLASGSGALGQSVISANTRPTTVVPEPSALLLLFTSGCVVFARRRNLLRVSTTNA